MQVVSLRLPEQLMRDVDAVAQQLQADTPLLDVTRTDALRYLIQLGLAAAQRQKAKRGLR